jgi:hypothetical protein
LSASNHACVRMRIGIEIVSSCLYDNLYIDMGWTGTIHGYPPRWCFLIRQCGVVCLWVQNSKTCGFYIETVYPVLDERGLSDFTRPPLMRYAGLVAFNPIYEVLFILPWGFGPVRSLRLLILYRLHLVAFLIFCVVSYRM